jgi:hypothetical protein
MPARLAPLTSFPRPGASRRDRLRIALLQFVLLLGGLAVLVGLVAMLVTPILR